MRWIASSVSRPRSFVESDFEPPALEELGEDEERREGDQDDRQEASHVHGQTTLPAPEARDSVLPLD